MNFRGFLSVFGVLFLLVSLTTCTKKTEEKITITWAVGKDATGAQRDLIKQFQKKYPDIEIKLMEMPESATIQHDSYVTYLSAGDSSIDVYSIDIIWPSEFASAGWVLPLDSYFTKDKQKEFLSGPIKGCTFKGKIYAVPWFTDAGILYYRKDILKKENLKPPETWQELISQAKKIQDKYKIYGFVFQSRQYEGLVCNFLEYVWSNGGKLTDGRAVEALKLIVDIIHKHKIVPEGITTYKEEESRQIFTSGNACFHRNWPYVWALAQDEKKGSMVVGKVGISPLPHFPGGESASCLGGWNLTISKFSKNPDSAWKFVDFMTSFESQKYYSIKGGRLPTRIAVYKDKEVLKTSPHYADMFKVFVTALPRPVTPNYSRISDILQVEIHQALTLKKSPEEALKDAEKKIKHL